MCVVGECWWWSSSAATELAALFVGSFLASSILPGGVEILLYAMVESTRHSSLTLLIIATLGNTLGALFTFALGALLSRTITAANTAFIQRLRARITLSPPALSRVRKWGAPCLLFTWLPVVGDPLCLAGGYLRLPWRRCLLFIACGKFLRYLVLLWVFGWG